MSQPKRPVSVFDLPESFCIEIPAICMHCERPIRVRAKSRWDIIPPDKLVGGGIKLTATVRVHRVDSDRPCCAAQTYDHTHCRILADAVIAAVRDAEPQTPARELTGAILTTLHNALDIHKPTGKLLFGDPKAKPPPLIQWPLRPPPPWSD